MDNLPDWISAISTLGGFLFAVYAYLNWKQQPYRARTIEVCFQLTDALEEVASRLVELETSVNNVYYYNKRSSVMESASKAITIWSRLNYCVSLDERQRSIEIIKSFQQRLHALNEVKQIDKKAIAEAIQNVQAAIIAATIHIHRMASPFTLKLASKRVITRWKAKYVAWRKKLPVSAKELE